MTTMDLKKKIWSVDCHLKFRFPINLKKKGGGGDIRVNAIRIIKQ